MLNSLNLKYFLILIYFTLPLQLQAADKPSDTKGAVSIIDLPEGRITAVVVDRDSTLDSIKNPGSNPNESKTISYVIYPENTDPKKVKEIHNAVENAPENSRPAIVDWATHVPSRIKNKIRKVDDKIRHAIESLNPTKQIQRPKRWEAYLLTAYIGENIIKWYVFEASLPEVAKFSVTVFSAVVLYFFNWHQASYAIVDIGNKTGKMMANFFSKGVPSDRKMKKFKFAMTLLTDVLTATALSTTFYTLYGLQSPTNPFFWQNVILTALTGVAASLPWMIKLNQWKTKALYLKKLEKNGYTLEILMGLGLPKENVSKYIAPISLDTNRKFFQTLKAMRTVLFPWIVTSAPLLPLVLDSRTTALIAFGTIGANGIIFALQGDQIIRYLKEKKLLEKFKQRGDSIKKLKKNNLFPLNSILKKSRCEAAISNF